MCQLPGVGIFGTSHAVHTLVPALRDRGFRIEAIWGRKLEEVESTAAKLNIPFFTTKIDDVVLRKDVDLIVIFTSPNLHAQISVKALRIGKHVVCDRPGGLNQTESLRMVRAAAYYPSLLAILAYSLRFLPNMSLLRKLMKEKYIGNVKLCDIRILCGSLLGSNYSWQCDSNMGGGALSLLGSHVIDLLSYLGLGRVIRVNATLRTLTPVTTSIGGIREVSCDDLCVVQLHMNDGVIATLNINTNLAGYSQEVVVCGDQGHLIAHGGDLRGRTLKDQREEVLFIDVEELNTGETGTPSLTRMHVKGLLRMASYLRDRFSLQQTESGHQPLDVYLEPSNFDQGLYVQSVIEALRKSNSSRQWVKVETNTEEGLDSMDSWFSYS